MEIYQILVKKSKKIFCIFSWGHCELSKGGLKATAKRLK
jgi:hypothetical protein